MCFDWPPSLKARCTVIAWCELNEGDVDLVVAINNVMLPDKDNCIALKNVLIICSDSQRAWQIISFKNCSDKSNVKKPDHVDS